MKKRTFVSNLPPLSFQALDSVQKIETYAQLSLRTCGNEYSFNTQKALRILRSCVVASLDDQFSYYSSLPEYRPSWLAELTEKTIHATASLVGRAGADDWEYLVRELQQTVEDHLAKRVLRHEAAIAESKERRTQMRLDRNRLRKAYLSKFDVKILDICWAAKQHYSEWKRWLRHAVKDGSAPDRAFRAVLSSGKSPSQYRKERRPNGWK